MRRPERIAVAQTRAINDSRTLGSSNILFVTILFLIAAVVRLWGISKVHYWDEMVYLQNAQVICCGKTNYSELSFRPPLISVFYAAIFKVWHSIYGACIGVALLNALAPVFLFTSGRRSVGYVPAFLASSLFAVSPFFIGTFPVGFDSDNTGNSLLTDSPALTLITLSFWLLLKALEKPSFVRFCVSGIALALCLLMRFGSLSCVEILLVLTLLSPPIWKAVGSCLCGLAAGVAPYIIWCSVQFGDPLFTIREGWTHVEGPSQPFTFFLLNAVPIFSPIIIAGFALYISLIICPSLSKWLDQDMEEDAGRSRFQSSVQLFLVGWLFVAFLAFSCISHKEPRYIMPAAPPLFLLSGVGLSVVFRLRRKDLRFAAYGVLGVLLILTILPLRSLRTTRFVDRHVPDEEQAGKLMSTTLPPDTTLYMSFNYPTLAYYTNFRIHELSDVGPALYDDMKQIPPGEVLVVYKEAEAPSQSDVAWCDASPLFTRMADFPSLVVYRRLP